jgi:hypothetical protein
VEHVVVAEHVVGQPGRAGGERHDRVQLVRDQRRLHRGAGQPGRGGAQLPVTGPGQVVRGGLGLLEHLLAEPGQDEAGVPVVEADQVGQRAVLAGRQPGQVGPDVVLELVQQRTGLGDPDLLGVGELHRIDDHGPQVAQPGHRLVQHGGGRDAGRGRAVPPHADPGSVQRPGVAARGVAGRGGKI